MTTFDPKTEAAAFVLLTDGRTYSNPREYVADVAALLVRAVAAGRAEGLREALARVEQSKPMSLRLDGEWPKGWSAAYHQIKRHVEALTSAAAPPVGAGEPTT